MPSGCLPLNAETSAIAGSVPAPRPPRALRMVRTPENQVPQEQVTLGEPIISGGSPSSPPNNEVPTPTVAPPRTGYGGMSIPSGGPGEGTTYVPSEIESAGTAVGVEQFEGFVRPPTEASENEIPIHEEAELDGDQSTESQASYEKSQQAMHRHQANLLRAGRFSPDGDPSGASRNASPKPVW